MVKANETKEKQKRQTGSQIEKLQDHVTNSATCLISNPSTLNKTLNIQKSHNQTKTVKKRFWDSQSHGMKGSLGKLTVDAIIVILGSVLMFGIIPHRVVFLDLASVHTTFLQIAMHTGIALACILGFRFIIKVYTKSWSEDNLHSCLTIIISDAMAGLVYLFITDIILRSVYPFLLSVSLFAIICIISVFVRLLYSVIAENVTPTEQ